MPTSQNRIDANRRNARKSTGPRTDDGNAASGGSPACGWGTWTREDGTFEALHSARR